LQPKSFVAILRQVRLLRIKWFRYKLLLEQKSVLAAKAEAESVLGEEVVTEIVAAPTFWPAEGYHQDFYRKNPLRYSFYRNACGRDRRIEELWGEAAMAGIEG
jgi:hypothetical protein